MNPSKKLFFATITVLVFGSGCFLPVKGFRDQPGKKPPQTHPETHVRQPENPPVHTTVPPTPKRHGGVYHTVERGETIFRLSNIYGVTQDAIIQANGITDVTKIKVGQVLFIPGGKRPRNVADANNGVAPPIRPIPPQPPVDPTNPSNPTRVDPIPPQPPTQPVQPTVPTGACEAGKVEFAWPSEGKYSSGFGIRHGRQHDGIDLTGPIGSVLRAAADGVVIYSDRLGGYGLIVIIKHEGDIKTVYAHNRKNLVKKGDTVRKGDPVAELGNSGNATGPHLHFEIRCGQDAVDPIVYLPKK